MKDSKDYSPEQASAIAWRKNSLAELGASATILAAAHERHRAAIENAIEASAHCHELGLEYADIGQPSASETQIALNRQLDETHEQLYRNSADELADEINAEAS